MMIYLIESEAFLYFLIILHLMLEIVNWFCRKTENLLASVPDIAVVANFCALGFYFCYRCLRNDYEEYNELDSGN